MMAFLFVMLCSSAVWANSEIEFAQRKIKIIRNYSQHGSLRSVESTVDGLAEALDQSQLTLVDVGTTDQELKDLWTAARTKHLAYLVESLRESYNSAERNFWIRTYPNCSFNNVDDLYAVILAIINGEIDANPNGLWSPKGKAAEMFKEAFPGAIAPEVVGTTRTEIYSMITTLRFTRISQNLDALRQEMSKVETKEMEFQALDEEAQEKARDDGFHNDCLTEFLFFFRDLQKFGFDLNDLGTSKAELISIWEKGRCERGVMRARDCWSVHFETLREYLALLEWIESLRN